MADESDTIPVPDQLRSLPREGRGFIIPAETPWVGSDVHLAKFDIIRNLALAAARACAVCGFQLRPGETVWRIFTQRDAATARVEPEMTPDLSAAGHESCMLYSTLVCPYWRSAGARLSKDSLLAPGAKRGTMPALLGYRDVELLAEPHADLLDTTAPRFQFLYVGLTDDIRFKDPQADMRTLLAPAMERDAWLSALPEEQRAFWTGSAEDEARLARYLRRAVPRLLKRRSAEIPVGTPDGKLFVRLELEAVM